MPARLIIIAVCILLVAMTSSSSAATYPPQPAGSYATIVLGDGSPAEPEQSWLRASRMPSSIGVMDLLREPCESKNSAACAYSLVYLPCPDDPTTQCRVRARIKVPAVDNGWHLMNFFHEVGHVVLWRVLTEKDKTKFRQINGGPWSDEIAADAYANCALYPSSYYLFLKTAYGWQPSRWQFRKTCQLLRRAIRRYRNTIGEVPWLVAYPVSVKPPDPLPETAPPSTSGGSVCSSTGPCPGRPLPPNPPPPPGGPPSGCADESVACPPPPPPPDTCGDEGDGGGVNGGGSSTTTDPCRTIP